MDQSAAAWAEAPANHATAVHPYHYAAPPEYHQRPNLIQQPYYYPYQAPNPCPNGTTVVVPPAEPPPVQPPAPTEAYVPEQYVPVGSLEGYYAPTSLLPPPAGTAGAGLSHYYAPVIGGGDANIAALKEAVRQYGVDPNGHGSSLTSSSNGLVPKVELQLKPLINKVNHPAMKRIKKKPLKPRVKLMRSSYCEVCKCECNSADVLESHRQGKKHKKNLQKLQEAITPKPSKPPKSNSKKKDQALADGGSNDTMQEQRGKKTSALPITEDLEAKKQKILQAGAKESEVRICTVCNIVVNNQSVFNYHVAGQKHASMLKKRQENEKSG
ncbi:hypothetical protein J5N97_015823 [Dioscorea zingiberensis]|uniref:U1-type domain-containing protein n=1 Tax=Dioscorea zingiberensis TaxID=325984 RepID=A0A9D5CI90_9LILI|nr:hypothetical protein J5N97_015823 [Dioscorea zingiberensis]